MGAELDPEPLQNGMSADSDTMDRKDCAEPDTPRQNITYQGTGWQALVYQSLKEPSDPLHLARVVDQVVVNFPTADLASDFVNNQKTQWAGCSNARFTVMEADTPTLTSLSSFHDSDGILSITATPQGAEGWACGRALTVRNNIVVDVAACDHEKQETEAIAIAKQIAEKVGLVE